MSYSEHSCVDMSKKADFGEEALKLFKELNLDPTGDARNTARRNYNNLDPVWKHPKTGAKVFVGNRVAAMSVRTHILSMP